MPHFFFIKNEEILKFSMRLAVVLGGLFLADLLGFTILSILISVGGNGYLLYFSGKFFEDFKSDSVKPFLGALLVSVLSECCALFNLSYTKESKAFWLFVGLHAFRDLLISARLFYDIYKSNIYNDVWVRVMPFPCVGLLFILLEIFLFGKETSRFMVFLLYNAVTCLPLLTAASRIHHTSYSGFFIMIFGTLALVASDVFYFSKFLGTTTEQTTSIDFRATFLLLGNALIQYATYDHITEYEKESKKTYYLTTNEEELGKARGKFIKFNSRPLQEPLI
jgi:hypothetical protein